jgi:16S rRNA (cytidine1402-2'-O)-methyltransferase
MPTLYIVSVTLGNPEDLSARAKTTLQDADLVIGEEFKETSKLLKRLGRVNEFELLNEHSSESEIQDLVHKIQSVNMSCLVSDAGTPLLEDPGLALVQLLQKHKVPIKAIPGPSALLTALVLSGLPASPFSFLGFLPREDKERKLMIQKSLQIKHTLIWYETPYRYKKVIQEIAEQCSGDKKIFLGLNLTCSDEYQFHGKISDLIKKLDTLPKSPPVIVLDNSK